MRTTWPASWPRAGSAVATWAVGAPEPRCPWSTSSGCEGDRRGRADGGPGELPLRPCRAPYCDLGDAAPRRGSLRHGGCGRLGAMMNAFARPTARWAVTASLLAVLAVYAAKSETEWSDDAEAFMGQRKYAEAAAAYKASARFHPPFQ